MFESSHAILMAPDSILDTAMIDKQPRNTLKNHVSSYIRDSRLAEQLNLENCVKFVGQIPNEEVPHSMSAADIFVLPSLSESFCIVNLEAMASGLPIVATNVGGIPEIVKDGENGFLVEPRNSGQITEKVLTLIEDDNLRKKIIKNNKEKVKNYSWDTVAEKLSRLYTMIIGKYKAEQNRFKVLTK